MKKAVKILSVLIIVSMLAALIVACGNSTSKSSSSTTQGVSATTSTAESAKKLEQVNLTVLTGGDQPDQPGFPAVSDEIAKATADNINVKLDVQTYAWGDYINKVDTMLAAGQEIDIYLTFDGKLQQDADKKQIIPLNDLLSQYGTDLKKVIPTDIWSDGTYKEKIYGVPALYPFIGIDCILIRGDLREKYKLSPVTDLTSFENYLDAVVKGEKGMVGFDCRDGGRGYKIADYFLNGNRDYFQYVSVGYNSVGLIRNTKPYKVENALASPENKKIIDWNRKAYANGWEAKDVLTQKDDSMLFQSGKSAALLSDAYTLNNIAPSMEKNISGCKLEAVYINDYKNMTRTVKIGNFAAISSISKNQERAMMFLNWTRASQENYNLLMYGIKGKDWVAVDEKTYDIGPGIDPAKKPYSPTPWWFKNMNMDLNTKDSMPEFVKIYTDVLAAKYTTPKLIGFSYDSNAMKAKIAQINTTLLERVAPVLTGIKSSDADYQEAIAALDKAGVPDVLADMQKQLDAWAAVNDK